MAADIVVTRDNSREFLEALDTQIYTALEECGLAAEGYAKRLCAVDTGLLRNSITHALDGQPTAISEYQDNSKKQSGSYSGSTPKEPKGRRAVYIGTNVEYAPYVELGTSRTAEQPFLKPAVENNKSAYQSIMKRHLQS